MHDDDDTALRRARVRLAAAEAATGGGLFGRAEESVYEEIAAVRRWGQAAVDELRAAREALVVAEAAALDAALGTTQPRDAPAAPQNLKKRHHTVEDDARLKNRIEAVLAAAKTKWPHKAGRPPITQMVIELRRGGRAQGYSEDTLRKILNGTYGTAERLGISLDW
jgi:hypothetical protein